MKAVDNINLYVNLISHTYKKKSKLKKFISKFLGR